MATPYVPVPRLRTSVILINDGDNLNEVHLRVPVQHALDLGSSGAATYAKNYQTLKVKASGAFVMGAAAGYADGKRAWVICGGDSDSTDCYIGFSRDGVSWAEQANPRYTELRGAAYSPVHNTWALVGEAIGGDAYILTSPNGRAPFTERSNPANYGLNGICVGPAGEFIAVGDAGYILRSTDGGVTWAAQVAPDMSYMKAVTYAAGLFVAVGGAIWTSVDGINWLVRSNPFGNQITGVAYNGAYFCALALGGEIARSQYGISWTLVRGGIDYAGWNRALAADPATGIFIGAGNQTTGILISIDEGLTWDAFDVLGYHDGVTVNQVLSATFGHGRFLLGGMNATVALGLIR
jgi:hypothetical protein